MSPHRSKWLWYTLVVLAGPTYSPVRSVAGRTPPNTPATIEAQAKFFQDFFSVQLSPYKIEFGHVCEDPNTWEQRYERKDYKNHRDMGKVRWGDKQGGYGEHYWDLNHAGHGHGDDHGHGEDYGPGSEDSYDVHEHDNNDSYDEPSEQSPNYDNNQSNTYDNDDYDSEKAAHEEANRAKRHPKPRTDNNEEEYGEVKRIKPKKRKQRGENPVTSRIVVVEDTEEHEKPKNEGYKKPQRKYKPVLKELNFEDDDTTNTYTDTDQAVKATSEKQNQYTPQPETEPTRYVPYEAGAGVRQYRPPDITPAASIPRLFLEPSTGHVIDRATGQAYILQPIVTNNSYNVN